MVAKISAVENSVIDMGPDSYYTDQFRSVMEDHMTYLRNHPNTAIQAVLPNEADQWKGDFFGLLSAKNIPAKLHWIVMRMNNYTSPLKPDENLIAFMIPDPTVVEQIRQMSTAAKPIS
jgi:hypothetical protein